MGGGSEFEKKRLLDQGGGDYPMGQSSQSKYLVRKLLHGERSVWLFIWALRFCKRKNAEKKKIFAQNEVEEVILRRKCQQRSRRALFVGRELAANSSARIRHTTGRPNVRLERRKESEPSLSKRTTEKEMDLSYPQTPIVDGMWRVSRGGSTSRNAKRSVKGKA